MGTLNLLTIAFVTWIALSIGQTTAQTTIAIIEPQSTTQLISGIASAHNELVCSTWGNYHFLTFDGDLFQLPSTCNHILTSQCGGSYEAFNVQLRRQMVNGEPTISKISMKLDGAVVELSKDLISVNGQKVTLPFVTNGIYIEMRSSYITVKSTVGLTTMWNEDDAFMIELDAKYKNRTCGLCGDFNGIPTYNEMIKNDVVISPSDYGSLWKMDGPTERCEDLPAPTYTNCGDENFCRQLFLNPEFSSCTSLVSVNMFVKACVEDLCQCNTTTDSSCLCKSVAEYSRQCVHAGGKPGNWRTDVFCPQSCSGTMQYTECGSPCVDTCSNSERGDICGEHCIDGCFCPPGTVWDDVTNSSCIPLSSCSCVHEGQIYNSGDNYTASCRECTCSGGQWACVYKDCPGTCSVLGGSHIITFDEKPYTFHGECSYLLAKECTGNDFTVLGDLMQCGLSNTESCLKTVTIALSQGSKLIQVDSTGNVNVDKIYTQLPLFTADLSIYMPSSFYIIIRVIKSNILLQIQLVPIMQVFITLTPVFKGQTCGLCGNFNNIQADDFTSPSGLTEGTAENFANSWKTRANCPDIQKSFEDPCSLSTENEKYAQHWCSLLSDPSGVFASCHSEISPKTYQTNCIYDTCNCEKSEDCMCAALSSYARACAAKGIVLSNWRDAACNNATVCPSSLVFSYEMTSCKRTCHFIGKEDYTCINPVKVEGCGCASGTYMNENGVCVDENNCPCYDSNTIIQPGEIISKDSTTCTCKQGKLSCFGALKVEECVAPMTFFNCSSAAPGSTGSECQKSCKLLDMACISTECVSGCMCPPGLLSDGKGGCITEDLCPCVHNGVNFQPGESVQDGCNTCTCKDSRWQCTTNQCRGSCAIYGDGHYLTFDEKRYVFNGNCEYVLSQDFCSGSSVNGSFRIITENIPCGTTGTTCSKSIKLFIGSNELILSDGTYQVVQRSNGGEIPYQFRTMGNYLVVETYNGIMLVWDRKTTIYIVLSPQFNGNVCGLCGNFDGNANNDFTTRSQEVVIDPVTFGNSWKVSPTCPEALAVSDPCANNPYREAWAQKQCSIINSNTFAACHSKVEPASFYSACVSDACACDTGGDCECFCTAVAAYAKACNAAGVCIAWRSPKVCPLFCDYYNPPGECEWHYKPCGHACMKTCRNPTGNCTMETPALEGCYPECPEDLPLFDEDTMKCVSQCGCYADMIRYEIGQSIPAKNNCQICECTSNGESCKYDVNACTCQHNGTMYKYRDIIYYTTDGLGNCISAICAEDGNINKTVEACTTTVPPTVPTTPLTTTPTPTTVFVFTTPEITTPSVTTTEAPETTSAMTTGEIKTSRISVTTATTAIAAITKTRSTLTGTTGTIITSIKSVSPFIPTEMTSKAPTKTTSVPPEITTTQPVETSTAKETTISTATPITTPTITTGESKTAQISVTTETTAIAAITKTPSTLTGTTSTTSTSMKSMSSFIPTEVMSTGPTQTTSVPPEISTTQPLETTPPKETTISPEATTLPITTLPITTTLAPGVTTTQPATETTISPEFTTLTTTPVVKATTVVPEVTSTQVPTTPPKETTGPAETTLISTAVPKTTSVPPEISTTQPLETTPPKETTISPEAATLPITTLPITTTLAPGVTTTQPATETTISPEITTLTATPVVKATTVMPEVTSTQVPTTPPKETTGPAETTLISTAFPKTTSVPPEISTTQPLETTPPKETTISPEATTLPITTLPITTLAPGVTTTQPATETTISPEFTTLTTTPVVKATTVVPEVTSTQVPTTPPKETTGSAETTLITTAVPKTTSVPPEISTTQPLETTPPKETTISPEATTLPITTLPITTTLAPGVTTTQPATETTISPEFTRLTTTPVVKATTVVPEVTSTQVPTTPPKETTGPAETTLISTAVPKTTSVPPEISTTQPLETTPPKETTISAEATTLPITTLPITTTLAPGVTTTQPATETTISPEITTLTTTPVVKATTVIPEVTSTQVPTTPPKETTGPAETTLISTAVPKTTSVPPEISTTQPLESTPPKETTISPEATTLPITTLPITTTLAPGVTTTQPATETTISPEITTLTTTPVVKATTVIPEVTSTQPLETTPPKETTISPEATTLPITTLPITTTLAPGVTTTQPAIETTISPEITTLTTTPVVKATTVVPEVTSTQVPTTPPKETTGPAETTLITTAVPKTTSVPPEISTTQPLETTPPKETTISPEATTLPITTLPITTTLAPGVTTTQPATETTISPEITTLTTTPVVKATTVVPEVTSTQVPTTPPKETTGPAETTLITTAVPKTTSVPPEISTTQPLETTPPKETTISPEATTLPVTTLPITTTLAPGLTTTQPAIETTISPEITTLTTTPVVKATTVVPEVTSTQVPTTPPKETTGPAETTLITTAVPKTTSVPPEISTTQPLETTPPKETTISPEATTLPITTLPITTTLAPGVTTTQPAIETTISPEITTLTTTPVVKATTVVPEVTSTQVPTTPPKETTGPAETTLITTAVPKTTSVPPEISTTQPLETTPPKETTISPEATTLPVTTLPITTTLAPGLTTTQPAIETTISPEITTLTTTPVVKATTVVPEVTSTQVPTTPPKETTGPAETTLITTAVPKTTSVPPEISTTQPLETTPPKETTISPEATTLPVTTLPITTTLAPGLTTTQPAIETTISPEITTLTTTPVVKATTVVPEVTSTQVPTTPPKETTGPAETTLITTAVPKTTSVPPEISTTQPLETTPPKETTISPEATTLPITTLPITTTLAPGVTTTQPAIETTISPEITTLTTTPVVKATTVVPEVTKISTTQPLVTTPPKETTISSEATTLPITTLPITTTLAPGVTTTQPATETTISPEITTLSTTPVVKATTVVPEVTSTQVPTTPPKETTGPAETTLITTAVPKTTSVPPEISTTQPLETTPPKETTISPEATTLPITTLPITTTLAPGVTTTQPATETTISPEITTLTTTPVVKATTVVPEVTSTQVSTTPPKETTGPAETTLITTAVPKTTSVPPEISTTQPLETTSPKETTISPEATTLPITTLPFTTTLAPGLTTSQPATETTISPEITTLTTTPVVKATTVVPEVTSTQVPTTPTTIITTIPTSIITTATPMTTFGIVTGPKPTTVPTTVPSTGMQVNISTTVTLPVTTAPVCCFVNGTNFPSDTIIYNVTDGFGWCFTAYCNATCDVVTNSYSCLTTPPPITTTPFSTPAFTTTPTITPTSIPTLAPVPTTVAPVCASLNPPRKDGESWKVDNCTTATCTNGTVIYDPMYKCSPLEQITCANGRTPIKVYDETGCCFKYECECSCSGWSGSHYITFDGTAYTYSDNCSYILVQEIYNANLKIVLDKEVCSTGSSFCPQSLIITYNSQDVILTQTMTANGATNVVLVNNKQVYPVFNNSNYIITSTGMEVTVSIPEIKAQVTYTGTTFNIDLPFSEFQNNTEGLCGTCDNNQANDCRSPSGQIKSCENTAPSWQVPNKTCIAPTTLPPITVTTLVPPTTPYPCQPVICELFNISAFEECRSIIPFEPYMNSCEQDVCSGKPSCTSLQAYASACAKAGVCVNWRNYTNGECEYKCPPTKVYEACGPAVQPTCNSQYNEKYQEMMASESAQMQEGCFCMKGTTLFNSYSDVCVTSCACVGPDGSPKMPNETWQIGCQMCECDGESMSIQCNPVVCPTPVVPVCDRPGDVLINKTDGCCTSYECQCDTSQCVMPTMGCPLGFTQEINAVQQGECCPTYTCKPMKVCVQNGTIYQLGSRMPSDNVCEECECSSIMNNNTELLTPTCLAKQCNTTCDKGYEYQAVPGKCCGECIRTSCVVMINNATVIIPMNETFSSPDDKCVTYTCQDVNGDPMAKESTKVCPDFNPDICTPGTETTDADGCCKSCTPKSKCNKQSNTTVLVQNGCKSVTPVEITSCSGTCETSSMYSAESNTLTHMCSCCYEKETSKKQVDMICPDGTTTSYTYIHIDSCGCQASECTEKQRRRRSLNSDLSMRRPGKLHK
ncbi:hypothetical protein Q7C36_000774 [Tachysurus vachellii]|uniref:Mucin-5AC n=1 Tax=Tachysurus vachellii TaxID=175792 RepID=A0AA88P2D4_TACVA|nr:hypothetical protein Q7C36_000774 [Tachysurus vachellii]